MISQKVADGYTSPDHYMQGLAMKLSYSELVFIGTISANSISIGISHFHIDTNDGVSSYNMHCL